MASSEDKEQKVTMHCGTGVRSLMATSIAERYGFSNVHNLTGGFNKIKASNIPITVKSVEQIQKL